MIYLIYCSKTKTCKIGYSYNPDNRLKELQTGNPYHLELITTVPGDISIEKDIHSKFNHLKLKGEWFNYTQEIKDYFKVEIELDYTQFYHSLSKTLVQLDSLLSVKLLCWCFVEMSDKNMFTFNDLKAESLNDWLKKNNSKVYLPSKSSLCLVRYYR